MFSDSGGYYACTGSGCSQLDSSPVTVTNPVAGFTQDNNGVSMQIQPVSDFGATSVFGQLIFGINTASNNRIAGAAILYTDQNGDLSVNTGTRTMPGFIDSGTASYFFPDDGSIPICSDNRNWYCPPSPMSVNVDVIAGDASVDRPSSYRLSSYDSISADMEVAPTGKAAPCSTMALLGMCSACRSISIAASMGQFSRATATRCTTRFRDGCSEPRRESWRPVGLS
ncbi:DUF3443 family protein [Burkholderia pseudomallei]